MAGDTDGDDGANGTGDDGADGTGDDGADGTGDDGANGTGEDGADGTGDDGADGTGGASDRTERLRELFVDVAGSETVTEEQADARGSLLDRGDGDVAGVVEAVLADAPTETDLPTGTYAELVRAFYDGDDDAAVAAALDLDERTAALARLDLRCFTTADLDPEFDADRAAALLDGTDPAADEPPVPGDDALAAVAEELDADPSAVERFAAARRARDRSLRASGRFREAFDDAVADADLSRRLAAGVREDGLDGATEDAEVDVEF